MPATLVGALAILLWSSLAALTAASGDMPPFQLAAITFAIGAAVGVASWSVRGKAAVRALKQPPKVWALGVAGLFGYHALYFFALKKAPPAEASLLNYLWPLLIVVFSALLPGERLAPRHVLGALLGLAGTVVLLCGRATIELDEQTVIGCAAAATAAVVWAAYSVTSRRFAEVPSDAVVGFCAATAVLSALAHSISEPTIWPTSGGQWACIVALGLGPVGIAFYVWDHGMKHGDIRLLGTLSYATPILSTVILIAAGFAKATPALLVSCALIIAAATIAAKKVEQTRN